MKKRTTAPSVARRFVAFFTSHNVPAFPAVPKLQFLEQAQTIPVLHPEGNMIKNRKWRRRRAIFALKHFIFVPKYPAFTPNNPFFA
jgi:hypothetical protein